MIKPLLPRLAPRAAGLLLTCLTLTCLALGAAFVPAARASTQQWSIMDDDHQLHDHLSSTISEMHALGATMLKVTVRWNSIAPRASAKHAPKGFKAGSPGSYPKAKWAWLDGVVRTAAQDGIKVGLMVTEPAPVWAEGSGIPRGHKATIGNWRPSAPDFGAFMKALGTRFDGRYVPAGSSTALPAVTWWSIWNEPNFGPDLAPQATDNERIDSAAIMYRSLLNHAWGALKATGHVNSDNTIVFGETAPRGRQGAHFPGNFSGTVPLAFLRSLYCLSQSNRVLTGAAARANHCPTRRSAFRSHNPALFKSSGFADHPYAQGTPPTLPTYACGSTFCSNPRTRRSNSDYADFAVLGRLERLLKRVDAIYGVHRQVPIWNTEYGYWTRPPNHAKDALSPAKAAYYMNWAEYLSYRNPAIRSYGQYLLVDPQSGVFASGLELYNHSPLATYGAFRMPLYMPRTSANGPRSLTVWGAIRPAPYTPGIALAEIQFKPRGGKSWSTLKTVMVNSVRGYFSTSVPFQKSGSVRVAWAESPTETHHSRTQAIQIK